MSIKKRLILSNIGMIVIPMFGFLVTEIFLGYFFFVVLQERNEQLFMTVRWMMMVLVLIITNGLLTYYVSKSIIVPITKLSLAAQKISEGNLDYSITSDKKDELGKLSNMFEEMRLNLKEARAIQAQYEQNRKELVASISHDLKTPLTSIKGYVKGVQDGVANTPEKLNRYIDTIYEKANDMDELIDQLFLYSKLDLERLPLQFEKVDLSSFFADFVDELAFQLKEEQGIVTFFMDKEASFMVKADREQLKRVVTNIFQNSLKYMNKTQKVIEISLQSKPKEVIVTMKDNGSGIQKEDLPFIFESFYRTDTSRNSSTGGSGLGLAIVKKIIEGHGGTLWAESDLGNGTSIHFTLKKVV